MDEVVLSVLMPTYQHEHYLRERICSLILALNRLEASWELLIIDDCCPGETWKILEEEAAKEPRIRALRNATNQGALRILNTLLQEARGEYCHFCASDDVIAPEFYEKTLGELLKDPGKGIAFSHQAILYHDTGDIFHRPLNPTANPLHLTPTQMIRKMGGDQLRICSHASIFRKSAAMDIGGICENLGYLCDWALVHSIALRDGAIFIPEVLSAWRRDEGGSVSVSIEKDEKAQKAHYHHFIEYFISLTEKKIRGNVIRSGILGPFLRRTHVIGVQYVGAYAWAGFWKVFRWFHQRWGRPIEDFRSEEVKMPAPDWA